MNGDIKKPISLFSSALRQINREVSDFKLLGRKKYYTIYDAKFVWRRDLGQCYDCGILLNPRGRTFDSGYFTHRVPIKLGGKISKDNLILVCSHHKTERDKKKKSPAKKIAGYNALSDILVHLIEATLKKDEEKIKYFKLHFDAELKDIVDSKYYPIDSIKELDQIPENPISYYVIELTNKLIKELEIIDQTKTYAPSRE